MKVDGVEQDKVVLLLAPSTLVTEVALFLFSKKILLLTSRVAHACYFLISCFYIFVPRPGLPRITVTLGYYQPNNLRVVASVLGATLSFVHHGSYITPLRIADKIVGHHLGERPRKCLLLLKEKATLAG